jgi:hypothetical protein
MAISMRRLGIARLARRKFDRRLAVFGSIKLLYFAMERVASEERVIFFLFQAAWSVGAFFISGGDIARDRFALGSGLGALEDNDVSRHNYSLLSDTGSSSSPSPPSSSVNPNSEVTGCRIRVAFFCFSISVWHSTV